MKPKPRGCPVNLSLMRRTSFTATTCATRLCSVSALCNKHACSWKEVDDANFTHILLVYRNTTCRGQGVICRWP